MKNNDQERIAQAYKTLEKKWDAQGECRSCGCHALLREHRVDDADILEALDKCDGELWLPCVSKDRDPDNDDHRGVYVYLTD